jgi:N utilization substance protein A
VLIPNALQPAEIDEVMLCQLLGRAIVLVREDQLSLAIGRRGQNVRLASKLVGWDIEIMTSEELDELIEKAVGAFTKIDGVDTDLAEKLVEQGILSYDDLSVMEIDDLVNTIEGLSEEQTREIVAQAETLAEAQADEMPRRKGARSPAAASASAPAPVETSPVEPAAADGGSGRAVRPTLDDLFGESESAVGSDAVGEEDSLAATEEETDGDDESDLTASSESDEIRDLALASEGTTDQDGREITAPPSDADQNETVRIVTEAVEEGASPEENEADEAGAEGNVPPTPTKEPFSTDDVEGRDSDMHQP